MTSGVPRRRLLGVIGVLAVPLLPAQLRAAQVDAEARFQAGRQLYESEAFADARAAFEEALEHAPLESEYHHWLGKAYGRMAEQALFLSALTYADRARRAFERAVELDGDNRDALWSLMLFYDEAPGFLGGGEDKALALAQRIADIDGTTPEQVLEDARSD